jgi:GTP-binding protein
MMMDEPSHDPAQQLMHDQSDVLQPHRENAQALFRKPVVFWTESPASSHLPAASLPEVAFWGRSNVGKSSLLNALIGSQQARVSKAPGRTQLLNFFQVSDPELCLVDLPGYGYAKLSKTTAEEISERITRYLLSPQSPDLLMILVDARHGLTTADYQILPLLQIFEGQIVFVGTKCDKLSKNEMQNMKRQLRSQLDVEGYKDCLLTFSSSLNKTGMEDLRSLMVRLTLT